MSDCAPTPPSQEACGMSEVCQIPPPNGLNSICQYEKDAYMINQPRRRSLM